MEDSIESKFLLHIIDASDPFVSERINVVNEILDDIWANQPRIMVFNKIDLIDQDKLNELKNTYKDENPIFISVRDEIWLDDLKWIIAKMI